MSGEVGQIYCQRCLAANSLGQELCARCGTRLMLVVERSALRYEEETNSADEHDEHLLERVSALENRLARVAARLEQGLDLLLRHARTSYFDHALLETLIGVLSEAKTVDQAELEDLWRERCERDAEEIAETNRLEELRGRIVAHYVGRERELFARLVKEGFALLDDEQLRRGVRALERAAALAPDNVPLNAFLGEHFFRAGKMALARDYLARAFAADSGDARVCLLLGLACGEEGEAGRAKDLLSEAVRRGGDSFAAHYALGRLHAAEADWKGALAEFKLALAARPCPEAHYTIGLVNYQLMRDRMALRHLVKAVEMDPEYAEAFYLLGLVHLRMGERKRAAEAFDAAHAADQEEPRYRAARQRLRGRSGEVPPPSLFGTARQGRRRLVTGGDSRLAAALQEDALGVTVAR